MNNNQNINKHIANMFSPLILFGSDFSILLFFSLHASNWKSWRNRILSISAAQIIKYQCNVTWLVNWINFHPSEQWNFLGNVIMTVMNDLIYHSLKIYHVECAMMMVFRKDFPWYFMYIKRVTGKIDQNS